MGRKPASLAELLAWVASAPDGTSIPVAALSELLEPLAKGVSAGVTAVTPPTATPVPSSWRERLWTAPADTRLGVREVAEALGRPRSWVYRRTSEKSPKGPLPHKKLDGELVFVAGELRAWLRRVEVRRGEFRTDDHDSQPSRA